MGNFIWKEKIKQEWQNSVERKQEQTIIQRVTKEEEQASLTESDSKVEWSVQWNHNIYVVITVEISCYNSSRTIRHIYFLTCYESKSIIQEHLKKKKKKQQKKNKNKMIMMDKKMRF